MLHLLVALLVLFFDQVGFGEPKIYYVNFVLVVKSNTNVFRFHVPIYDALCMYFLQNLHHLNHDVEARLQAAPVLRLVQQRLQTVSEHVHNHDV